MDKTPTKSPSFKRLSSNASSVPGMLENEVYNTKLQNGVYNTKLPQKSKGAPPKHTSTKENVKSSDFRLHTEQRATRRAMFNHSVATKFFLMELQKKQVEKVLKIMENEDKRTLRKEMVPRAQLMPYFNKPFSPQRSNRPLTVPKEPNFRNMNTKCWSCMSDDELYRIEQAFLWNPIKCHAHAP